eukprot:scaffold218_cov333-Prasinococcus_capsulatus_cf.AAC.8
MSAAAAPAARSSGAPTTLCQLVVASPAPRRGRRRRSAHPAGDCARLPVMCGAASSISAAHSTRSGAGMSAYRTSAN